MEQELHKNPNQAMNEMMQRIDLMRDIYIRETNALEDADSKAFLSLQEEKSQRAGEYQQGIEHILKRKEEMRNADPSLKKKLQDMQADFAGLAQKNLEALQRMQRCSERLGDTLRSAAKESLRQRTVYGYNETGRVNNVQRAVISAGLSETA